MEEAEPGSGSWETRGHQVAPWTGRVETGTGWAATLRGGVTWIMSSEELLCDVPHLGWLKVAGTLASVARRDTG